MDGSAGLLREAELYEPEDELRESTPWEVTQRARVHVRRMTGIETLRAVERTGTKRGPVRESRRAGRNMRERPGVLRLL